MAIPKQSRHIPFNQGLDDKIDNKLAPDGFMKRIENCVFTKDGRLDSAPTFYEVNDKINLNGDITVSYTHLTLPTNREV